MYRIAGAIFLLLAAAAAVSSVALFFIGRAFVANISPVEGQIGLGVLGAVAVGLYAAARHCARRGDPVDLREPSRDTV
jgi:hypothetical protein